MQQVLTLAYSYVKSNLNSGGMCHARASKPAALTLSLFPLIIPNEVSPLSFSLSLVEKTSIGCRGCFSRGVTRHGVTRHGVSRTCMRVRNKRWGECSHPSIRPIAERYVISYDVTERVTHVVAERRRGYFGSREPSRRKRTDLESLQMSASLRYKNIILHSI